VYGDDVAILVGDLLLAGAFQLVADHQPGPPQRRLLAVSALAAGCEEMIRGQFLDLRPPPAPDETWLRAMCSLKTGSLLRAAVNAGLALADADEPTSRVYRAFASELGVGFQIVDDVLDATGSNEMLGKPAGSDAARGKQTYVTVLGLDEARRLADASYARCRLLVDALPGEPGALAAISERVYRRQS